MVSEKDQPSTPGDSATKPCLFCAEEIKANARLCRFCGKDQVEPKGEETLFDGSPSMAAFIGLLIVDALLCLLLIGIPMLLYHILYIKSLRYMISTKKITHESGTFSKSIDTLQLYRVQDHTYRRSFWESLLGLGTIYIVSSDKTDPKLELKGLPDSKELYNRLAAAVEDCRVEAGVRLREIES